MEIMLCSRENKARETMAEDEVSQYQSQDEREEV